jgi:AcrR family transcriptional regulator
MKQEVREFKRERILSETSRIFYERGFGGSSIDAIAERLNVTKPFIYSYFHSKHALLLALYERAIENLNSGVDEIFGSDEKPEEQVRRLVQFYVRRNVESRELTAIFLNEERNLAPASLEKFRVQQRLFDKKLTLLIVRGVDAGVFKVSDATVASFSISGMVRWVHRWYDPEGRLNVADLCRLMSTLALNLLGYTKRRTNSKRRSESGKRKSG